MPNVMIIMPLLGRHILFYEKDVHYVMVTFVLKTRALVVLERRKVFKGAVGSSETFSMRV
jgi:hypothetical protein